jgi:cellobiose phosphorylase
MRSAASLGDAGRREEKDIVFELGVGRDLDKVRHLIQIFRSVDSCRDALEAVWANWKDTLESVQVQTPDPALEPAGQGWLLYQTLSARMWARTDSINRGGAFGFRDRAPGRHGAVHSRPGLLREALITRGGAPVSRVGTCNTGGILRPTAVCARISRMIICGFPLRGDHAIT